MKSQDEERPFIDVANELQVTQNTSNEQSSLPHNPMMIDSRESGLEFSMDTLSKEDAAEVP